MTSKMKQKIIRFFSKYKRIDDLVIYACTSDYPVDFDNTCLLEIYKLTKNYRNKVMLDFLVITLELVLIMQLTL